jgi:hypothetical protein
VLGVIDGLVQEHRHVAVIQRVDDRSPGSLGVHEAQMAEHAELVGYSGAFHADGVGQVADGARALPQGTEDPQPAGGGQGLHRLRDSLGGVGVDVGGRRDPAARSVSHERHPNNLI